MQTEGLSTGQVWTTLQLYRGQSAFHHTLAAALEPVASPLSVSSKEE